MDPLGGPWDAGVQSGRSNALERLSYFGVWLGNEIRTSTKNRVKKHSPLRVFDVHISIVRSFSCMVCCQFTTLLPILFGILSAYLCILACTPSHKLFCYLNYFFRLPSGKPGPPLGRRLLHVVQQDSDI